MPMLKMAVTSDTVHTSDSHFDVAFIISAAGTRIWRPRQRIMALVGESVTAYDMSINFKKNIAFRMSQLDFSKV